MKSGLLSSAFSERGARGVVWAAIPVLVFLTLACNFLAPAVTLTATPPPGSPTPPPATTPSPTPTTTPQAASIFVGVYECSGHEFGMLASAGGLTLNTEGTATYVDYDQQRHAGTWAAGGQGNTLTFSGSDLASATYDHAQDMLLVQLKPNSHVAHADGDSLECARVKPSTSATANVSATDGVSSPQAAGPAYTGQFDCDGLENGLRAYSGRITVRPSGSVTFKDYDGSVETGTWTYDTSGNSFTFNGSLALASALYDRGSDSLVVVLVPAARVVHADDGGMQCQRARPGTTGPP